MLKMALQSHTYLIQLPKKRDTTEHRTYLIGSDYNKPTFSKMSEFRHTIMGIHGVHSVLSANDYGQITIEVYPACKQSLATTISRVTKIANAML